MNKEDRLDALDDDDHVQLVFVTASNWVPAGVVTRKLASDIMRGWFYARSVIAEGRDEDGSIYRHLKYGTYASNVIDPNDENHSICYAVVAWDHVVGIYTREIAAVPGDEWKES